MTNVKNTDFLLDEARKRGDLDDLAEALTVHANTLVESGQIAKARLNLDEAANIHHEQGRTYDEARCTQFAATLCRFEGQFDEAIIRVKRAAQLAVPGTPISVSVATELGEIALAQGNGSVAADAYSQALSEGKAAGLVETARAELLRKRAIALVLAGRHKEGAEDLTKAHDLLLQAGNRTEAIRTLIEKASALQQGGDLASAEKVTHYAIQAAKTAHDELAQADLYLIKSAQALERRNAAAAMAEARTARTHALAATAPVSYVSATIAIAELSDASKDRLAAYEALAVGWVTLGDLLGQDIGKATFKPKLLELRKRWGTMVFNQIKAAYEAQRRTASDT